MFFTLWFVQSKGGNQSFYFKRKQRNFKICIQVEHICKVWFLNKKNAFM